MPAIQNIYLLAKTPNIILLYFCSKYGTAEIGNVSVNIMQYLAALQKVTPTFKF